MEVLVPKARSSRGAIPIDEVSAGMLRYEVRVRPEEVVLVKGVIEAHDGLAGVFAEHGGDLVLAAPPGRAAELEELLADLAREFGAVVVATERSRE